MATQASVDGLALLAPAEHLVGLVHQVGQVHQVSAVGQVHQVSVVTRVRQLLLKEPYTITHSCRSVQPQVIFIS